MVEQQIGVLSHELEGIADTDAGCSRIQQIPGIGPIVTTAIVAAIGNGAVFRKGREFAAWLGLVPRQYSNGGKARLMGISKRGNTYLRKILVHGARDAVYRIKRDHAPIGCGPTITLSQLGVTAELRGRYGSPLDNTAHAIRPSLLANATMRTLCALGAPARPNWSCASSRGAKRIIVNQSLDQSATANFAVAREGADAFMQSVFTNPVYLDEKPLALIGKRLGDEVVVVSL